MSDPNARKILLVGDVRGRLDDLYKRVARVNKPPAGPFDALFCVGPFFEGAADDAALLQHHHPEAGFRQVTSAHQTVVATSHPGDIVCQRIAHRPGLNAST